MTHQCCHRAEEGRTKSGDRNCGSVAQSSALRCCNNLFFCTPWISFMRVCTCACASTRARDRCRCDPPPAPPAHVVYVRRTCVYTRQNSFVVVYSKLALRGPASKGRMIARFSDSAGLSRFFLAYIISPTSMRKRPRLRAARTRCQHTFFIDFRGVCRIHVFCVKSKRQH